MISSPVIVGCGTLGSVLATRLVKENLTTELTIYDYDCASASEKYPFRPAEQGLLKTKIIKLICNKLNPYVQVNAITDKVITPCIKSSCIIDCRDQKDTCIGAHIALSLDGYRLYIDSRCIRCPTKNYYKYMFPRVPEYVETAITIIVEYLKNDMHIYQDMRLYNAKTNEMIMKI